MANESRQKTGRLDLISQIAGLRLADLKRSNSHIQFVVLLLAAIFFIQDIYVDVLIEHKVFEHITIESGIFIAVLLALGIEVKRVIDLHSTVSVSQKEIARLKSHLADVIRNQFKLWQLTRTEREIALLLIKGLSMQEIAQIRQVKEKSVRQQAARIYPKAGVANRNELTAHFIEDLLAPDIT